MKRNLYSLKHKIRLCILGSGLLAIVLCAMLCGSFQVYAQVHNQQIASADPLVTTTAVQHTSDTTPKKPPVNSSSTTTSSPVQTCVPISTGTPSALDLTHADGLVQQIDTPTLYQIYGNTADTLRSQIKRCAPKDSGGDSAEFVADTTYQLTWSYTYENVGGTCRITGASVGLHVTQTMPLWFATANAQNGLAGKWATFANNLRTHEDGHTSLDIQHAQQLVSDLRSFPVRPCDQLTQSVKLLVDTDLSELAQANDNYDAATNHGATQGAILP